LNSFINKNYKNLKLIKPNLAILYRESIHVQKPLLIARFEYGKEKIIDLTEKNEHQIRIKFIVTLIFNNFDHTFEKCKMNLAQ